MGKRKKIGLVYEYDENWIGGTYYIENLIDALNTIPDEKKPVIVILSTKKAYYKTLKEKTTYPFLKYETVVLKNNLLFRIVNKISAATIKRRIIYKNIKSVDTVFPFLSDSFASLNHIKNKIFWIPDFQDHFIPELFKEDELIYRKNMQTDIAYNQRFVILSSQSSKVHFQLLFPNYTVKDFILPFAVTHPAFEHLSIKEILKKYNIPELYFMCPNQFWKHKNHLVVIEAVKSLKDNLGIDVHVVFSGKPSDYRNPGFYDNLLQKVSDYSLNNQIFFLGFIDRKEQLKLMKHARAIIQPSLFEGWSTVVEDAKAINKMMITSNIPVHIEQLQGSNAEFFEPTDHIALMNLLKEFKDQKEIPLYDSFDYKSKIKVFGEKLYDIFSFIE